MSHVIYADLKSLIKKIDGCANNAVKPSTAKLGEHIPCRDSMSTIWTFDNLENKYSLYRGKD